MCPDDNELVVLEHTLLASLAAIPQHPLVKFIFVWHHNAGARDRRRRCAQSRRFPRLTAHTPKQILMFSRSPIASVLNRFRLAGAITFYDMAGGRRTYDPDAVRDSVATEVGTWFADEGDLTVDRSGVPEPLCDAITAGNLESALRKVSPDKVPGQLMFTYRVYSRLGRRAAAHLLAIFSGSLRMQTAPADWLEGTIHLVPKTQDRWSSTASAMRPITLLQYAPKLCLRVLVDRMYGVLARRDVLRRTVDSVLLGTDTGGLIAALGAAVTQARGHSNPCSIRLPEPFIWFYMDGMLANRRARVVTAYGVSGSVTLHRGIPQGSIESPLLWAIFYDVVLALVNVKNLALPGGPPLGVMYGRRRVGSHVFAAHAVRNLGVWFTAGSDGKAAVAAPTAELNAVLDLQRRKPITGKTAVYIINSVVPPSMASRCRLAYPSASVMAAWNRTARVLVRSKLKLPMPSPTSLLHYRYLVGLCDFRSHLLADFVTDLLVALNGPARACVSHLTMIAYAQAHLGTPWPPL
ncbi:hypothetical protein GGF31_001816 [Allomyces arbusculus]|nr:hypothetical protein GGF31_001816 [Allomyces arbusculus]